MLTPRDINNCPKRKISLATLLSGLVALSVALTFTIQLIASYQSKKEALFHTTLTLNHSNAMKMSLTLDSLFKSMRSSLQHTAGLFASNPLMFESETVMNEHLELMRQSSNYFNSIIIVDEEGIVSSVMPAANGMTGKAITTDAVKEALALIDLPASQSHWNREADLLTRTIMLAVADIKEQTDLLTQAAATDPLTGLTNRRSMEQTMNGWMSEQTSFSIIVTDLDKFKAVNDTYGHQVGDEVLRRLAKTVVQAVSSFDVCCRYGGEEFVILLAGATAAEAYGVAERIRQKMETSEEPVGKPVTLSLGIAHYPSHALTAEALFMEADQALYEAKRTGRNRTVIARPSGFIAE